MNGRAAEQLCEDVHARVVVPVAGLLGTDLEAILRVRVDEAADRIVAELSDADAAAAAGTAHDLVFVLWGESDPEPQWWQSPLGRLVAGALSDRADKLTHAQAARMLGVTRGTVATLVHRGTLERHPDGGVLASAVMRRLSRSARR